MFRSVCAILLAQAAACWSSRLHNVLGAQECDSVLPAVGAPLLTESATQTLPGVGEDFPETQSVKQILKHSFIELQNIIVRQGGVPQTKWVETSDTVSDNKGEITSLRTWSQM